VAGGDPGIFDRCHSEYSSLAEVWIVSRDECIGYDGANQRTYEEGYQVFFGLYGAGELKNGPKGAIWFYLPSAIIRRI